MVAYVGVQKALCGMPVTEDVELLQKCTKAQYHCAERSAVASKFHGVLQAHLDLLEEHVKSTPTDNDATKAKELPLGDVLFTLHEGTSELHAAARRLLRLTQRPLVGIEEYSDDAAMFNSDESTAGSHLEWEYELKGCTFAGSNQAVSGKMDQQVPAQKSTKPKQQYFSQPLGEAWSTFTPASWDLCTPQVTY